MENRDCLASSDQRGANSVIIAPWPADVGRFRKAAFLENYLVVEFALVF